MKRFEMIQDYVYSHYAKIYSPMIRIVALSHTASVVNNAALLALFAKEDVELCKIAAVLHDYSQFYEGALPKNHGPQCAIFSKTYLESTSLFTKEEIELICHAISVHSEKYHIHSPFDEILKNADLLAKYLNDTEQPLADYEKKRLDDALKIFHN